MVSCGHDNASEAAASLTNSAIINTSTLLVTPNPPSRTINEWKVWTVIERDRVARSTTTAGRSSTTTTTTTTYTGGCHCGSVRFKCKAPRDLVVWDCNCSDCRLRRNAHFVVRRSDLTCNTELNDDSHGVSSSLTEYRWGTGKAGHYFCSICGISPFYVPRSNPDGYAITFACLDGDDDNIIDNVEVRRFDGLHWEDCIEKEGKDIKHVSKGDATS